MTRSSIEHRAARKRQNSRLSVGRTKTTVVAVMAEDDEYIDPTFDQLFEGTVIFLPCFMFRRVHNKLPTFEPCAWFADTKMAA